MKNLDPRLTAHGLRRNSNSRKDAKTQRAKEQGNLSSNHRRPSPIIENQIAREVVDAAYQIHTSLGPGLLESVYEAAMVYELEERGLLVYRQFPIPVVYHDVSLEVGFLADLVVNDKLIVELKSVEFTLPVHKKQLLTYIKLANLRLGLLINFGEERIKDGITRLVNRLPE